MSNEIKVFSNKEFGKIRTITINDGPWFVGKDAATILGYKDTVSAVKIHVDDEDKTVWQITTPSRGQQTMVVINESGLYSLIFGSQLPSAKRFKHWITSEVLPSLRQNGGYIVGQEDMTPEEVVANALVVANRILAEKERKIKELAPKGKYFDALVESKLLTTFRDAAKEFHIPPQEFTRWLVNNEYIYRDKHKMIKPYAEYVKQGLFEVKDFLTPHGYSNVQTYITVKGKETFRLLMQLEMAE